MREALLQFPAGVFKDLQRRLCHLLVVHLQAAEQRLERLGRVEGHRVGKGQNLGTQRTRYILSKQNDRTYTPQTERRNRTLYRSVQPLRAMRIKSRKE